jgi:hypothetical protein
LAKLNRIDSESVEYDSESTQKVVGCLEKNMRGLTIADIATELGFNRHTVTKILDRLLIEKKVDYEEKGLTKIFYSTGSSKFVGSINQGEHNDIWVDIFKPKFEEEEFVRLNQTKHDYLIRSKNKYRSVGAIAVKKSKLDELIKFLQTKVKKEL